MKKATFLISIFFAVLFLSACSTDDNANTSLVSESASVSSESEEQVLYDGDTFKAVYQGVQVTAGFQMLNVRIENKTDGEITILPMDSSVNDTALQFTSGTPATMQGGKSINQAWLIGSDPAERIEFALFAYDENMAELEHTASIEIEVK